MKKRFLGRLFLFAAIFVSTASFASNLKSGMHVIDTNMMLGTYSEDVNATIVNASYSGTISVAFPLGELTVPNYFPKSVDANKIASYTVDPVLSSKSIVWTNPVFYGNGDDGCYFQFARAQDNHFLVAYEATNNGECDVNGPMLRVHVSLRGN